MVIIFKNSNSVNKKAKILDRHPQITVINILEASSCICEHTHTLKQDQLLSPHGVLPGFIRIKNMAISHF